MQKFVAFSGLLAVVVAGSLLAVWSIEGAPPPAMRQGHVKIAVLKPEDTWVFSGSIGLQAFEEVEPDGSRSIRPLELPFVFRAEQEFLNVSEAKVSIFGLVIPSASSDPVIELSLDGAPVGTLTMPLQALLEGSSVPKFTIPISVPAGFVPGVHTLEVVPSTAALVFFNIELFLSYEFSTPK